MSEAANEQAKKRPQIGDRVGAVLYADEKKVGLLGYGVYEGTAKPPFGPFGTSREEYEGIIAQMKSSGELPADAEDPFVVPKITLDNGEVVWGPECWWGAEDKIKAMIGDREIVMETVSQH